VRCSELQCVAVCGSYWLQEIAVCCSSFHLFQCVAVCCSALPLLQCVVVRCSTLQLPAIELTFEKCSNQFLDFVFCCGVLQCVVVCCSVLQCVAICSCSYWLLNCHLRNVEMILEIFFSTM